MTYLDLLRAKFDARLCEKHGRSMCGDDEGLIAKIESLEIQADSLLIRITSWNEVSKSRLCIRYTGEQFDS